MGTPGIIGAAASIFFAYVGFDAISTAAEETRDPQRNVPIGLIGALAICTVFYLLVAAGAIGAYGATPVTAADGTALSSGSSALAARCTQLSGSLPLACSGEALAHVLRSIGHTGAGNLLGLAVFVALPSVILTMIFGQTRIFFVMARDGLLPSVLGKTHERYRTPHVVTIATGIGVVLGAAFFPVGKLADISNSGTLFAFLVVSLAVMMLRKSDPDRPRSFRTPMVWLIGPLSVIGCIVLYAFLPLSAKLVFPIWGAVGLVVYFAYSRRRSNMRPQVVASPQGEVTRA
jgi:APA family basic amino acid/polyamine antiporter